MDAEREINEDPETSPAYGDAEVLLVECAGVLAQTLGGFHVLHSRTDITVSVLDDCPHSICRAAYRMLARVKQ